MSSSENKVLAKTKVFSFVEGALKGKISQERLAFCYALFPSFFISKKKTEALEKELSLYENPIKQKNIYNNQLRDDKALARAVLEFKKNSEHKDMIFIYPKYAITDDVIPDIVKEMGYKIKRNIVPIKMLWNHKDRTVEAYNLNNKKKFNPFATGQFNPFGDFTMGYVNNNELYMNDCLLILSAEDYKAAKKGLKTLKNITKILTPDEAGRDLSLAFCLDKFVLNLEKEREFHMIHELHHIMNRILLEARDAKDDVGKISLEDTYRLEMHNEISANMSEIFKAIEKYQKKGDYSDLSVFSCGRYKWLQAQIKKTPVDKRKNLVANIDYLMLRNSYEWRVNYEKSYSGKSENKKFKQFGENLSSKIKEGRILKFGNDKDEYLKQRNLMYQFRIYNPKTKICEYRDVSNKIAEIDIPKGDIHIVLNPLAKMLVQKQKKLQSMNIDEAVVSGFRQEFRDKNDEEIKMFESFYLNKYVKNIR